MNAVRYLITAILFGLFIAFFFAVRNIHSQPTFEQRWAPVRYIQLHDQIHGLLLKLGNITIVHVVATGPECSWVNRCRVS